MKKTKVFMCVVTLAILSALSSLPFAAYCSSKDNEEVVAAEDLTLFPSLSAGNNAVSMSAI